MTVQNSFSEVAPSAATLPLLSAALALAANGFRIFPLIPNGKRPAMRDWKALATTDPQTLKGWWNANPEYNVGVATGRGLIVLDFDCKNGKSGLASLEFLDMLGLPQSYRVRTPSGGMHVYFHCADKAGVTVSVDAIAGFPGVDVRCEGGLVAGAGSVIDGAAYVEA